MITFKLDNKQIHMPSSWEDLTFSQYIKIMEGQKDIPGIISVLTGIDVEVLRKAEIKGLDMVIQSIAFLNKPPKFDGVCSQVGKYKLPLNSKGEFNIQFESLAQFEDMRQAMRQVVSNDIKSHTLAYATYVSIYLQKIKDKEYNYDDALKMIPDVMQMPAHEVIIAGGFFFLKLLNSLHGTPTTSPTTPQNQKKNRPASTNSKKHSARSRR